MSNPGSSSNGALERALDDKQRMSSQVSANNRYISFGLVAITWTILTSDSSFAAKLLAAHPFWVMLVGATGCMGVILDYLHYTNAVAVATKAINNTTKGHEHENNEKWPEYKRRECFYKLRTITAIFGTGLLIILILLSWCTLQDRADHEGSGWNINQLMR